MIGENIKEQIKEEIEEAFNVKTLITDELCDYETDTRNLYRKHGLPPLDDDKWDEWEEKAKTVELQDKYEEKILKVIKNYLLGY